MEEPQSSDLLLCDSDVNYPYLQALGEEYKISFMQKESVSSFQAQKQGTELFFATHLPGLTFDMELDSAILSIYFCL